ncbi:MAG: hypothetical protein EYC71_07960 [Gammaproteobacteria bacterium]|nr:MAG: hypothetical protein EYC71_07960 [Gammaproteobacteria bacterium]
MSKRLILALAVVASTAWAQQNVDISAEQFNSGDANGTLSALGRQAAASGKRLVITAPSHWHSKIAASIRAGGNADIVLKDGFYENLLVRVEEGVPEAAKEEPKPATKPEVKATPVAVEPVRTPPPAASQPAPAPQPAELPVPPPPPPAVESAAPPVIEEAPIEQAVPEPAPQPEVVEQAATPQQAEASAVSESTEASEATAQKTIADPKAPVMLSANEPGDTDTVRSRLESRYNEGKRISERVEVLKLRTGDVIYVDDTAAVVARREGGRLYRMWLIGSLNLNQIGISRDGSNRYRVIGKVVE